VADQTVDGNVIKQRFTGGEIAWDKRTNKFSTQPANLAGGLAGLSVPGYEPPSASNTAAANSKKNDWFTPSWWWLLAGIPLLVLVALILIASLRHRHGGDVEPFDDYDYDLDHGDPDHEAEAEEAEARLAGTEERSRVQLAESYGRPPEAAPYGLGGVGHDPFEESGDDEVEEFSDLEPEPDESDTAPTPIQSDSDAPSGRHAAVVLDEPPVEEAEPVTAPVADVAEVANVAADDEPEAQTAIHLPLDDPYLAPTGYPIKADTKSGLYWGPESDLYDHVPAEVYFVSEELARANGFVKAE
jgi:uncharacterized protein with LGFP repeats